MQEDTDIIEHLINVESEAELLIKNAKKEAEQKLQEVKICAEEKFKEGYTKICSEIQSREDSLKKQISLDQQKDFDDYCKSLQAIPTDLNSFFSYMDSCYGNG